MFTIKERPEGLALPVLLADRDQLAQVAVEFSDSAQALAELFWPGPLTLVMRRNESLPARLTAGHSTVAVRVPDHPVPRKLAQQLGRPITGTSANISGASDPRNLAELCRQVGGRVDRVVNAGPTPTGTASTIIELTSDGPKLLREGAISFEEIAAILNTD